jgi:hypothetical protein
LLALVCVAGLLCPSGTMAQGLGLDLGGRGSVDLGGGGDSRLDLGVELGGSGGGLRLSLDAVGPPLGQKAALQAVRKRQALPLEDILLRAKRLTDGEVIDAQLVSLQDVLLYEIKVLGTSGDVSELFFLARTGEFLDLN